MTRIIGAEWQRTIFVVDIGKALLQLTAKKRKNLAVYKASGHEHTTGSNSPGAGE
jgi:hypothetical protein